MKHEEVEDVTKDLLAMDVLKRINADVIIPKMIVKGKKVYGIGIKGKKAYVVYPEGMEEEIRKVLKVEEVIVIEDSN